MLCYVIISPSSVCDLGVYIDADLSMRTYVAKTTAGCIAALRSIRFELYGGRCLHHQRKIRAVKISLRQRDFGIRIKAQKEHGIVTHFFKFCLDTIILFPERIRYILRSCQHDNGYINGRSQIKRTIHVHRARSFVVVTHPPSIY